MKKGDVEAASKIPQGTLGTSTGVAKNADNELSLIDLGGDNESSSNGNTAAPAEPSAPLEDDLLGLSFNDAPSPNAGGISLGMGNNSRKFPKIHGIYNYLS